MSAVHVMHGRLSPPEEGRFQAFPASSWEEEFPRAAQAGLDGIEWIYEMHGHERNPLGTDAGLQRMRALAGEHGVVVESLCADWFMDRPLLRDSDAGMRELAWLAGRCAAVGIERVVLPFVDASRLATPQEAEQLAKLLGEFDSEGVELHLETDLGPEEFASLLERVDNPLVMANYDTGNSAALGFDPREEWAAYGDRIGSVHVKDRERGGGTVALGEGAAELPWVLAELRTRGWERPLVLQVARGEDGREVEHLAAVAAKVRGWT